MQGKMGSGSGQHMPPAEMMMTPAQMAAMQAEEKAVHKSGMPRPTKGK
ncbi:MAG: hypothetical protein NUW01_08865 [Gemmatimonadaceae bacterium]|nr:hypothetical protein [Gemmatimonadaceae bacterium]